MYRILDLYCCAGGAAVGYASAGFEVAGVDIAHRERYPFRFHQADAIVFVKEHGHTFDAIHASPPCQGYTALAAVHGNEHPMLIEPTRDALNATGKPWVIENVPGAPIRHDLKLWGPHFDLGVLQPRYFELGGWSVEQPDLKPKQGRVRGWRHGTYYDGPYVAVYGKGGGKASVKEAQDAKGIHWTDDWVELCEAIPPAYTKWIGRKLIEHLDQEGEQ